MKAIKFFFCLICIVNFSLFCFSQDFSISINDIRIETDYSDSGTITGYHLYIKKLDGINSVLLTETTKDPLGLEANYAYRASEWNAVNGDEIRMLDGKKLESEYAKFSIIDSTPQEDKIFGQAFHLYIPTELIYGYPWTRNGIVKVGRGTFINIRSFGAKYADYSAGFGDNPFMFDLGEPVKKPEKKEAACAASLLRKDYFLVLTRYFVLTQPSVPLYRTLDQVSPALMTQTMVPPWSWSRSFELTLASLRKFTGPSPVRT